MHHPPDTEQVPQVVGKWEMLGAEFVNSATPVVLLPANKIFIFGDSSLDPDEFKKPTRPWKISESRVNFSIPHPLLQRSSFRAFTLYSSPGRIRWKTDILGFIGPSLPITPSETPDELISLNWQERLKLRAWPEPYVVSKTRFL